MRDPNQEPVPVETGLERWAKEGGPVQKGLAAYGIGCIILPLALFVVFLIVMVIVAIGD